MRFLCRVIHSNLKSFIFVFFFNKAQHNEIVWIIQEEISKFSIRRQWSVIKQMMKVKSELLFIFLFYKNLKYITLLTDWLILVFAAVLYLRKTNSTFFKQR